MKAGILFTVVLVACASSAGAQSLTNRSHVLDGSGDWATNASHSHLAAAGQPGGIQVLSGGNHMLYAGFLGTFSLQPALDTDGDGMEDELDADNDGDRLSDLTENSGSAFSPVTPSNPNQADTDSDSMDDYGEAVAGTDPTDGDLNLHAWMGPVTSDQAVVEWLARGQHEREYTIRYSPDLLSEPPTNELATVTVPGGVGDWLVTTGRYTNAVSDEFRTYRISATMPE